MNFGETLKAAREAKNLTASQVAAQTHMLTQIVEDMEQEDFHRIAAPIYGRGFVRLYASCVGLDPAPLVKEFMDIYDGRRTPIVKTRPVPPPKVAPEQPVPEPQAESRQPQAASPAAEEPPAAGRQPQAAFPAVEPPPVITPEPPAASVKPQADFPAAQPQAASHKPPAAAQAAPAAVPNAVKGLELFDSDAHQQPAPVVPPPPPAAAPQAASLEPQATPRPQAAPAPAKDYSRFAAPLPAEDSPSVDYGASPSDRFRSGLSSVSTGVLRSVRGIPSPVWRISFLVVALFAILGFAAWGLVALFHATMTPPARMMERPAPMAPISLDSPRPAPQPAAPVAKPAPDRRPAPAVKQTAPNARRSSGTASNRKSNQKRR